MSEQEQPPTTNGALPETPSKTQNHDETPETKAERGEAEQPQNELPSSGPPAVEEAHSETAVNGEAGSHEAHTNGVEPQAYSLPVREKRSEHTEKVVSATVEDPASLEAAGVKDQENKTDVQPDSTSASAETLDIPASTNEAALQPEPSPSHPQVNGTPAKSPRVPTYLQGTAASSLKSSPKASPSRLPTAKTPQSTSKLANNLRKVSENKGPSAGASSAPGPTSTIDSPSRVAHLSHLTAPTASSKAKTDPTSAPAPKPLGRATSVRRKPVEGSRFLAPTAASSSHKTAPSSGSSLARSASKRERSSINPATASSATARKPSGSGPRSSLPPATGSSRPTGGARVPSSGSGSSGKPAPGSFLDRMTRPTEASAKKTHEKIEAVKSPPNGKAGGSLGRTGSVRTKVNGTANGATKRLAGKSTLSSEKKRVPSGVKSGQVNGIQVSEYTDQISGSCPDKDFRH